MFVDMSDSEYESESEHEVRMKMKHLCFIEIHKFNLI